MEGKELILCYEGPKAVDEVNWVRKRIGGNKRGQLDIAIGHVLPESEWYFFHWLGARNML